MAALLGDPASTGREATLIVHRCDYRAGTLGPLSNGHRGVNSEIMSADTELLRWTGRQSTYAKTMPSRGAGRAARGSIVVVADRQLRARRGPSVDGRRLPAARLDR